MAEETSKTSSAGTRKSGAKKATRKASQKQSGARAPRAQPARKPSGAKVAEQAARQLGELAGKDVEGVTALRRTDDGWQVELEVLELSRIPTTTDVLATYQVDLDTSGDLEEYRRLGRYVRGQVEEGS